MDCELLKFIYERCETNSLYLSRQIDISYHKLYCVRYYGYKLDNQELDILYQYLKVKKGYTDYFLNRKFNKIKRRNNGNIR